MYRIQEDDQPFKEPKGEDDNTQTSSTFGLANAKTAGMSWRTEQACRYEIDKEDEEDEEEKKPVDEEEEKAVDEEEKKAVDIISAKGKLEDYEKAELKRIEQVITFFAPLICPCAAKCVLHKRFLAGFDECRFAWQGANANGDSFSTAQISDPNCDDLHELPGLQILSSGCVHCEVCEFEDLSVVGRFLVCDSLPSR